MVRDEDVVLRRTWPQRLVILACLGVITASVAASFFVGDLYAGVADLGRVQFSGDLLDTETDPSEPVNFLIIGVDSAIGLDADDPAAFGRDVDDSGNALADTIAIVRIDPVGGQAWSLTIPRDLLVDIPGARVPVQKINASSLIVSGLWGLVWYREIRGKAAIAWVASAAFTAVMTVLLGMEKGG